MDYSIKSPAESRAIASKVLKFKRAEKVRAKWTDEEFAAEEKRLAVEVAALLAARSGAPQAATHPE